MSIWHNEAIPTTEKDKYVYVEFYTQIHYTNGETESRCITLASDCEGLEEPDLIRWCYLDDLLAQQSEINRLRRVLKNIIECAPACYNTDECPLKNGDGFDNGCGYNCAYFLAHEALDAEKETKKALQPSEAEQC